MSLTFRKNGFTTIFFTIQQQLTPTSSLSAYDLSSVTSTFAFSDTANGAPLWIKTSTDPTQIVHTSATAGQLEVYIQAADTDAMPTAKYFYSLYSVDTTGKKFSLAYDSIKLTDNLDT